MKDGFCKLGDRVKCDKCGYFTWTNSECPHCEKEMKRRQIGKFANIIVRILAVILSPLIIVAFVCVCCDMSSKWIKANWLQ